MRTKKSFLLAATLLGSLPAFAQMPDAPGVPYALPNPVAGPVAVATPSATPDMNAVNKILGQAKQWPEDFYQSVMNGYSDVRTDVQDQKVKWVNALFYSPTDLKIYSTTFAGISFSTGVQRNVYNNFDTINSFTILDRVHINMGTTLWSKSASSTDSMASVSISPFASVNFGVNGALDVRDMTQLVPSDITTNVPSVTDKQASLQNTMNPDPPGTVTDPDPTTEGDVKDINPYIDSLNLDHSLKVKLHKIWNPLTLPFRLPLSRSDMRYLKDGEVISYSLSGQLSFGGGAGFNVTPVAGLVTGVSVNVETHINGQFEVSVQREDKRHARVRISKITGHGSSTSAQVGINWNNILKGVFVIKPKTLPTIKTKIYTEDLQKDAQNEIDGYSFSIVPFSINLSNENDHELDVAYEYDLDSEEGRDAFHRAVLGNTVASEDVASDEINHPNPSVTKIFERTSRTKTTAQHHSIDLNIFFKHNGERTDSTVETEIILPDGTKQLFKSSSEDQKDTHTIRHSDKALRKISVLMDRDGFKSGADGSLLIIGENMVDDSSTHADDMNEYAAEVQDLFQDPTLFPVFPLKAPALDGKRSKKIHYGRSSFYYGVTLKEAQIKTFLNTPVETVAATADSYNVKFNKDAFHLAKDALGNRNGNELYNALTTLFKDHSHDFEMMKVMISTLNVQDVEKFLVAENGAFGSVQNRGPQISTIQQTLDKTGSTMGLSSDTNRSAPDPDAIISNLGTTKQKSDKKIELHFTLASNPEFIFFRLTPLTHSRSGGKSVEFTVYNRGGRFAKGANSLILDPSSEDPIIHRLTDGMEPNQIVMLSMGYTAQDQKWGPGASTQFATSPVYATPDDGNTTTDTANATTAEAGTTVIKMKKERKKKN